MEVSRLAIKLELQLLAHTTAIAMQDLNHVCNLHHSSWQHGILNQLSKARDQPCNLMDTSCVHNLLRHNRNSLRLLLDAVLSNRITSHRWLLNT